MEEHIAKGKGAKSRFGEHLWLDITLLGEQHIKRNLREVRDLPILPRRRSDEGDDRGAPTQHHDGRRPHQPSGEPDAWRLFAAGEGVLGHARLQPARNSVAETVAAGHRR